jgi:SUKH-4 immunity protein
MAVTRESVTRVFPAQDMSAVEPADLPADLVDPVARRVLTEVGLPRALAGCVYFDRVGTSMRTLGAFRKAEPTPPELADHYVIAVSDYYTMSLDGKTGECFFVTDSGQAFLAATTLDDFLDFMCQLLTELTTLEGDESDDDLDRKEDHLVEEFRRSDPRALSSSERAWRTTIRRCIGEVML